MHGERAHVDDALAALNDVAGLRRKRLAVHKVVVQTVAKQQRLGMWALLFVALGQGRPHGAGGHCVLKQTAIVAGGSRCAESADHAVIAGPHSILGGPDSGVGGRDTVIEVPEKHAGAQCEACLNIVGPFHASCCG